MVLQFQNIDIFIDKGLDQGTDDKLGQGFGRLDNVIFSNVGEASKREGYVLLSSSSLSLTSGSIFSMLENVSGSLYTTGSMVDQITALAARNQAGADQELVVLGSGSIWTYDSTTSKFIERGERRRASVSLLAFPQASDSKYSATSATIGNVRVTAYAAIPETPVTTFGDLTNTQLEFCVQDASTGHMIVPRQVLAVPNETAGNIYVTSVPVIVVPVGNTFFILYNQFTDASIYLTSNVYCRTISASTPWIISPPVRLIDTAYTAFVRNLKMFQATRWQSSQFGEVLLIVTMDGSRRIFVHVFNEDTSHVITTIMTQGDADPGAPGSMLLGLAATDNPYILFSSSSVKQDPEETPRWGAIGSIWQLFVNQTVTSGTLTDTGDHWPDYSGNICHQAVGHYDAGISTIHDSPGRMKWFYEYTGQTSGSIVTRTEDADEEEDLLTFSYIKGIEFKDSDIISGPEVAFQHARLAGYPFDATIKSGSTDIIKQLIPLVHQTREQSAGILSDLSGSIWGVWDRDRATPSDEKPRPQLAQFSGTQQFDMPYIRKSSIEATEGRSIFRGEMGLTRFNFQPSEPSFVGISDLLIHGGGQPRVYDGVHDVEMGFNYFPLMRPYPSTSIDRDMYPTFTTGSGQYITSGTRLYAATYHWYDAMGREHRSNPGVYASAVTTGSHKMTINVPTLSFTDRQAVRIKLWRSEDLGRELYLITSGSRGDIVNVPSASYVSFTDRMNDTTLISNEVLYTVGELPNDPPPNASIFCSSRNRLWMVDDDDGLSLWYSKPLSDQLAPEMSAEQIVKLDPIGGRITALVALDDKLIIFKRSSVYYIYGEGPDATGAGNAFSEPTQINVEFGCLGAHQVSNSFSAGLMFCSERGLCLLDRGMNITFIGLPVEDQTVAGEVIGITIDERLHLVRAALRSGNVLVYDTKVGLWTNHTLSGSLNSSVDAATIWNGDHVIAGKIGTTVMCLKATSGSYTDGPVPNDTSSLGGYPMRVQTRWINLAGVQGFQRINRASFIGSFHTDTDLKLSVEYDYGNSTALDYVVTGVNVSSFVNPISGSLFQFSHQLHHQKCEAVRFTLEDAVSGTNQQQGFSLSAVTLRVGVKPGDFRPSAGKRIR